jgi:ribosome-binding protein aMBF1 (putative translation factor)
MSTRQICNGCGARCRSRKDGTHVFCESTRKIEALRDAAEVPRGMGHLVLSGPMPAERLRVSDSGPEMPLSPEGRAIARAVVAKIKPRVQFIRASAARVQDAKLPPRSERQSGTVAALGLQIRAAREKLGMSGADLCKKSKISNPNWLWRVEAGKAKRPPADGVLERISTALGIRLQWPSAVEAKAVLRSAASPKTPPPALRPFFGPPPLTAEDDEAAE